MPLPSPFFFPRHRPSHPSHPPFPARCAPPLPPLRRPPHSSSPAGAPPLPLLLPTGAPASPPHSSSPDGAPPLHILLPPTAPLPSPFFFPWAPLLSLLPCLLLRSTRPRPLSGVAASLPSLWGAFTAACEAAQPIPSMAQGGSAPPGDAEQRVAMQIRPPPLPPWLH
ncbi:vegetative cell wall protein gp1-like [Miscanthus floridulus]|uniref:vegetative cell wall protein gp1-like n=1 Tax=Miscanthus floridulus TaxID=154761 RepID=UPI00345AA683